eukprot:SAG31_NODE_3002_length_4798_cov_2.473292_4_plen_186_part_00
MADAPPPPLPPPAEQLARADRQVKIVRWLMDGRPPTQGIDDDDDDAVAAATATLDEGVSGSARRLPRARAAAARAQLRSPLPIAGLRAVLAPDLGRRPPPHPTSETPAAPVFQFATAASTPLHTFEYSCCPPPFFNSRRRQATVGPPRTAPWAHLKARRPPDAGRWLALSAVRRPEFKTGAPTPL